MSNKIKSAYELQHYQGVSPESAKYIFWGTDANFDSILGVKEQELVIEYLEDGPSFWRRYKVHHPFLVEGYKFRAGRRYHRRFQALGFTPEYSSLISFVDVCGYSENAMFKSVGNVPNYCLNSLVKKCLSPGKINFMSISVLKELIRHLNCERSGVSLSESTERGLCELAEYKLEDKDRIPVFVGDAFAIIRHFHFSSTSFSNIRAFLLCDVRKAVEDKNFTKANRFGALYIF